MVANGRRFVVTNTMEVGNQVSVTLSVSGPEITDGVTVTKFFTFLPGTNIVTEIKDGVDMLALRAAWDESPLGE